jgi:dihydrofolate reductase
MSCSVFIATSLDGFIARPNGAIDWLPTTEPGGEDYGYHAFMDTIDAVVMGRNTYELVLAMGGGWTYPKPVVVLSSRKLTLENTLSETVVQMSGSPAEIAAQCAKRGWNSLYIDGGVTIQKFLADGLIERLIVTRVPVLLGQGLPLFGALAHDIALTHVRTESYESGLVQSEYRVHRA